MKKLASFLAGVISVVSLSQSAHAELSGQLELTGFSGGTCSLSVAATPNAGNLNLDLGFQSQVPVGTVSKNCDFPHHLTVSTNSANQGITRMMHSNGFDFADMNVFIDGQNINFQGSNVPATVANGEFLNSIPVTLDLFGSPGVPGMYSNTLTFTVVVD